MDNLFVVDELISDISPCSLIPAMSAASKILRSEFYKETIVQIYGNEIEQPHMRKEDLSQLLAQNDVFTIDRLRGMGKLNARAATLRQYDPWRVYFNPLLLLEMKDRERESKELVDPDFLSKDMIGIVPPFDANGEIVKRAKFNSLLHAKQLKDLRQSLEEPPSKKAKSVEPDVVQMNTLMLTILLVHECSRILNYLFSSLMDRTKSTQLYTPTKYYPRNIVDGKFVKNYLNFGHMVEKEVFGYVIHHAIDPDFQTPFGIHHIIGCDHEKVQTGFVLHPNPDLQALLAGDHENEITETMLKLVPVEAFAGEPVESIVINGSASTGGLIESSFDIGEGEDDISTEDSVKCAINFVRA